MLSEIQKTVVTILHRDGAMTLDALIEKVAAGITKSGGRQSIVKMIKAGHLLDANSHISLSAEMVEIAEDMAEHERSKKTDVVAAVRGNFSKGIFDGAKYYANVPRRDVHFMNAGASMALPRSAEA